jgi:hypothetical protein
MQRRRADTAWAALEALLGQAGHLIDDLGPAMSNHACRSFLLGALLMPADAFDHLDVDSAALAALAHDLGLVRPELSDRCFTAASAQAAQQTGSDLGMKEVSTARARDAVVAHFQPHPPPGSGPEALLLAAGTSADVMGYGMHRLHPQLRGEIWRAWPDLAFRKQFKGFLSQERARAPRSRAAVLARTGMGSLMRRDTR